jgi:hypothetical protein
MVTQSLRTGLRFLYLLASRHGSGKQTEHAREEYTPMRQRFTGH